MMKRFTVFLLIILLCTSFSSQTYAEVAHSQEVAFADPNLEIAIKSLLNKTSEESVSRLDLESLTEVDLSNRKIKNLQGLEYATNITQINLSFNEIADISPLKGLSKIRSLNLRENQISSIEDLSAMKELEFLAIDLNQISSLDAVKQLPRLQVLHANRNQISSIHGLSDAIEMTFLDLSNNKIEDIEPLGKLTKLKYLYVGDNQIRDISPLWVLSTNLASLSLDNNKITDVTPLAKLVNLTMLSISGNKITDLKPLKGLVKLDSLNASNNNIKDLAPLSGLVRLSLLNLSSNQIYDLEPLRNMKDLVDLSLSNNRIWNLEPIQNIEFKSSNEYFQGVGLYNNHLDLSKGTVTSKIFIKVNGIGDLEKVKKSQRKTQRLVIGSTTAYVGDSAYRITTAPFIHMGRTYVPVRFVSEKLGANVGWNQRTKEVTIQKNDKTIRWVVGNRQVRVNQQTVLFDSPLLTRNNTTFVPIRFVSEQLNASVEYLGSKKMVIIFEN